MELDRIEPELMARWAREVSIWRSVWLGRRCMPGHGTYVTTAADWRPAATKRRSMVDGPLACGFYAGPPLLVLDELGYLHLPAEAASALFRVVAQQYLKTLVVITTHCRSLNGRGSR